MGAMSCVLKTVAAKRNKSINGHRVLDLDIDPLGFVLSEIGTTTILANSDVGGVYEQNLMLLWWKLPIKN